MKYLSQMASVNCKQNWAKNGALSPSPYSGTPAYKSTVVNVLWPYQGIFIAFSYSNLKSLIKQKLISISRLSKGVHGQNSSVTGPINTVATEGTQVTLSCSISTATPMTWSFTPVGGTVELLCICGKPCTSGYNNSSPTTESCNLIISSVSLSIRVSQKTFFQKLSSANP